MIETSPRQVLYALVSAGFLLVVLALVVGAAAAGLVPTWWTVSMSVLVVAVGFWAAFRWRRTVPVLLGSIGVFVVWAVGTLLVS